MHDEGNRDWINKLETKIDNITVEFTRISTAILTKLDIYLSKQDDHEKRLSTLENLQSEQKGINDEGVRKINQLTLGVLAATMIVVAVGVWLKYN